MKKIIFILITMLCIGSYTTIEAANTYTKYQNSVRKSAKRSTRKFMKHKRNNTGRFHSLRSGKALCGVQSLSYQKIHKKCY
jgi:hypothetical protein